MRHLALKDFRYVETLSGSPKILTPLRMSMQETNRLHGRGTIANSGILARSRAYLPVTTIVPYFAPVAVAQRAGLMK